MSCLEALNIQRYIITKYKISALCGLGFQLLMVALIHMKFDSHEVDKQCLLQVEITQVQVGICVHMRLVC